MKTGLIGKPEQKEQKEPETVSQFAKNFADRLKEFPQNAKVVSFKMEYKDNGGEINIIEL